MTILKSFYVNDLLRQLATKLIEVCPQYGICLTKFPGHIKSVKDSLLQLEVSLNVSLEIDADHIEKALGLHWETMDDVITLLYTLNEGPSIKHLGS